MVPKLQLYLTNSLFDARIEDNGEESQGMGSNSLLLPMEGKASLITDVIGT
jgi:hypothetical protein